MSSKCPGKLEAETADGLTVFRIGPDGPRYKVRCLACGFAGEVGSLSSRMVCGSRVRASDAELLAEVERRGL